MRVYVASSWRNEFQQALVATLRAAGHDVYDFREEPGAFAWAEVDPTWETWDVAGFAKALKHPLALRGTEADWSALRAADVCVLLLPSGRSAHTEGGWCIGRKPICVVFPEGVPFEPELVYAMMDAMLPLDGVVPWLAVLATEAARECPCGCGVKLCKHGWRITRCNECFEALPRAKPMRHEHGHAFPMEKVT